LVFGYDKSGIGFALDYSVIKGWRTEEAAQGSNVGDRSTAYTHEGDNIGAYLSVPMGSSIFYLNVGWLTYAPSGSVEVGSTKASTDFSEIQGNVGLTGSSGSLSYDGYLNVIRTGGKTVVKNKTNIDNNSYLGAALHFNVGYAAFQIPTARIIIGSNNHIAMVSYDNVKVPKTDGNSIMGLTITPNILGEVAMTENWLAFAGAKQDINLTRFGTKTTSQLTIEHSDGTSASAGIRYQKTHWAVEAAVNNNVFDNPFTGFAGNSMFANVGAFINF